MMCEVESSAASSDVVDAVPMVDIIHRSPSDNSAVRTATPTVQDDVVGGRRLTPENSPSADDPTAEVATGPKHSKWGKLRQTVKATTVFASTVSGSAAASSGPSSTRGSRRKPESQADDRRDSFLKRFSTRQTSCGTAYLQSVSTDAVSTSNSNNLEPDGKVREQTNTILL